MNYLQVLNAFYDRLETNPLSSSAIALWHSLVHTNYKAGWIDEFAVAASVLCVKSGLKDSMFKKARNELAQKGYITFQSRKGNQSAVYRLNHLWSHSDRNGVHNGSHNGVRNGSHNGVPLFFYDNLLLPQHDNAREEIDPFTAYQQEIGPLTEIIKDNMLDWLEGGYFDEPELIVLEAIRESAIHEKRSWAYIDRVLRRCLQENVKTVDQMRQKKAEFEKAKMAKVTPIRGGDAGAGNQRRRAQTDVPKPITKGEAGRLNKPDNYNERMLQVHGQGWLPDDVI
ncbi:DnaD domain protein [Brevibacillus sp. NSP2.1]|uniref:DnaD domain-containing protein n=1 Tax=Brevibacillus sp. NSP2.1 TaxID=3003229 RepID=UPI0003FF85BD|nr:DnaD domain protein [Brevibacillus sp. NSP2.1]QHZ55792.1 DnaD domain protein [Brevibacillus sp. NSP2.1]